MPADARTFHSPAAITRLTGISMNTLRAWERRYGVPKPQRGPGGHRLYAEADLQLLQWLSKQLASGVSISHAIASWRAQQPARHDLHPEALVGELLAACESLDERRAERVFSDAFAHHTVERVCVQIVMPLLVRIGERWATGALTATVEHFASALVTSQLYAMLRVTPAPPQRPLLFVAGAPGDRHGLPTLMLTLLLRRAGWRALHFGPDLPLEDMAQILPELRPDVLMLSVVMAESFLPLGDQLARLRRHGGMPPVVLGGRAVAQDPAIAGRLGCHYLGDDPLAAIAKLDLLLAQLGVLAARGGGR